MFCATCGSEVDGLRCAVCGTVLPPIKVDGTSSAPRLSGWWRRVGATLVDELILVIPTYAVLLIVGTFAGVIVGALAGSALGGFYQVKLLTNPDGQTIGNRVLSSYVRDATTGQVLATGQALKRWGFVAAYSLFGLTGAHSGTVVVGVIGLVDCLYPLFNARKQTLHDIFAQTIVLIR
jgi:uncharacterized RDD family membrane protein YckC